MLTATALIGTNSLSAIPGWVLLLTIALLILLSGVVVMVGRYWMEIRKPRGRTQSSVEPNTVDATVVRSWIAIALVGGLLVFCAAAFALKDETLRSALIGGLVANAGAAVAFYFSTKSADQARQDVLSATQGTTNVPNLQGMSVADAKKEMASSPLQLVLDDPNAPPSHTVHTQTPAPGASVRTGSAVVVHTAPPPGALPAGAASAPAAGAGVPPAGGAGAPPAGAPPAGAPQTP